MEPAHLKFSTDILRRLGEELNPNPDQGILELVKNSYDADAHECIIELDRIHKPGGNITIKDNGDGMTRQDIEDSWLLLGKSTKTTNKKTRLGRVPAGNKGLGRLAALRLGEKTELSTRPGGGENKEFKLNINWKEFDKYDIVEEVDLTINESTRNQNSKNGTDIKIISLKNKISRADVKRLARGLLLLADPFTDSHSGFQPILKAPEFKDLENLVQRRYFDDAEFHLRADLDINGRVSASIIDYKGNDLFVGTHEEISPKGKIYECPVASFDLWAFILSSDKFSFRLTTVGEVRAWLKEFGGVHLYIHGLRVNPYGNPGNDWLDMNLSRVRDPELRPGTNTSIGRVEVKEVGDTLLQKTDRTGLVETEIFFELRRFATDALDWMARKRKGEREALRHKRKEEVEGEIVDAKKTINDAIKDLPEKDKKNVELQFNKYERARSKEARTLRKEVQLYRTLSTAGITAGIFAHESRHPLRLIDKNIKMVERKGLRSLPDSYNQLFGGHINLIKRQHRILKSFGDLTLNLIDHEKRRVRRVDVHNVIQNVSKMFESPSKEREVHIKLDFDPGNPYLRASEAAVESIISNVLTNSLKAFENMPPGERRISVQTKISDGLVEIHIADSGPGIQGIDLKDIWLPGETTYPNGTGLGLTIVKDTVRDLGGSVEALKECDLGGAKIIIQLPILGA